MSNYVMGRRLEYRIRDLFKREGYLVIRAASSKPIDLVCIKKGKTVLVECKAGGSWLGKVRKAELIGLSEQAGAPILLARRKRRKVEFTILLDGRKFGVKDLFSSIP
jgi:Holliday junction resolvase